MIRVLCSRLMMTNFIVSSLEAKIKAKAPIRNPIQ